MKLTASRDPVPLRGHHGVIKGQNPNIAMFGIKLKLEEYFNSICLNWVSLT